MLETRWAKTLVAISALAVHSADVSAGEYWLADAASFQIVTVVPTATGRLVYANSVLGVAQLDSGAYGSLVAGSGSTVDATNLSAGAAFSVSTGFGAATANGDWGLAFSAGYAFSGAGFVTIGAGSATVLDAGSASASVTNPGPNTSIADFDADGSVDFTANAAPAVSLTTSVDGQATISVAANVTPATNGFAIVPGMPAGTLRLAPAASPFVGAADADTPAIYADVAGSGSVTIEIVSGIVPVTASSSFDGRAALGVVGISSNGALTTTIDLASPALALATAAVNSSAITSLGSALGASLSTIDISGADANLSTSGTSSHAIAAGLFSQQETASLQIGLGADRALVSTSGDDSWGAVAFASSGLDHGSASLDLSGAGVQIDTSGQGSGGAMINADGVTGSLAQLRISGSGSGIATHNNGAAGAIVAATGAGDSEARAVLSGPAAAISTEGAGSAALTMAATGTTSETLAELSGASSTLTTSGAGSAGLLATARGVDVASVELRLSGAASSIGTAGDDASAALAAALANRARTTLALSGAGASIMTAGDNSAGFAGTAVGVDEATAEAILSGRGARLSTTGADSVGVALTAIASDPDGTALASLEVTGSGSGIDTSGANSSAVAMTGARVRMNVGKGARIATSGAGSHAALVVADDASVEIAAGGEVTTDQADAHGLFFVNAAGENLVINSGGVTTGGSAIVSAGSLRFTNHGSAVSRFGAGVDLASGEIWNGGLIAGQTAIMRSGGGSGSVNIENHGSIVANAGPAGAAIDLQGGFDDALSVAPDGIIVGSIELGGGTDSFTALPGANVDFLFASEPEDVTAVTGVQLATADPLNVVIVDPGYLAAAGSQTGLAAARMLFGGSSGAPMVVAQGDCGEALLTGQARAARDRFGGDGGSVSATASSYGVVSEYAPDTCNSGALSFFVGAGRTEIEAGGSRSRTDSIFAGGRYMGTTDGGLDYAFAGGVAHLTGESRRLVLNNRVASGVEIAQADYSGWTSFAGLRLSRTVMLEEVELTPYFAAHAAYGSGFDAQESGVLTPLNFAVGHGFGYDASLGVTVSLPAEAFDSGVLAVSFSGALVAAGFHSDTAVAAAGTPAAIYSRNTLNTGLALGAGFEIALDSTPARLTVNALATVWNHQKISMAINSTFKYYF